jgi:hypothetical protein
MPRDRDQDLVVVRLSGPADVVGVVPYRLGFAPSESLVVVCLHGPRRRDRVVMRFDLPSAGGDAALADEIAVRTRLAGCDGVLLVCYTARRTAHGLPRAPLIRAVRRALRRADLRLDEALLVARGRWWSYLCTRGGCCAPDGGTPLPERASSAVLAYAAETVAAGGVVLPDRAALVSSVEGDRVDLAAWVAAGDEVDRLLLDPDLDALYDVALELVGELVRRWEGGDPAVTTRDAALVAAGLADKTTRDRVMVRVLDDDAELLSAVFVALARVTPDAEAAPVCTVLAWFAHCAGNGVVAGAAVDRALRAEPGYEMALLIDAALEEMQPPQVLYEIAERVREELAG